MTLEKKQDNQLTIQNILKHVSQYDILHRVWPSHKELKLDRGAIESPFRSDNNPSFLISIDCEGKVRYKDMGSQEHKGSNVWKFVQQMEGLRNLHEVLQWVDRSFNLGYGNGNIIQGKPEIVTWQQPAKKPKKPTLLQVSVRKFNKEELRYWNEYHQDISDLKREEIYAPKEIWRDRKKLPMTIMTFCYYCSDIGKWKIYRPLAPKRTEDTPPHLWKWDNSIGNLQHVENIETMSGPIGICTKSRKDRMCIYKATGIKAICSVQAEDMSALSDEVLYRMWSECRNRYIVADSDQKGKQFSIQMCQEHGYKHINTPDWMLSEGINDVADMTKKYGVKAVTEMFKQKIGSVT